METSAICSEGPGSNGEEIDEPLGRTVTSMETVFQLNELREEIMHYAIYDNDNTGEISGKVVKNVRLVQESWLLSTSRLLRKLGEPVITLSLDGSNPLMATEDTSVEGRQLKMLDQLVARLGNPRRLDHSYLPIKLDLKLEFFREENYQSLCDFLTRLGGDLVELQLEYPKSRGSMPAIFPPFNLTLLRKLSFEFSDEDLRRNDNEVGVGDNRNGLALLQLILYASKVLKELVIPFTQDAVPPNFKYLQLPATITDLDMSAWLTSNHLEVLLRNQLPNLTQLTLQVHRVSFEDVLLFKILERVQKTLETLWINGVIKLHEHPWPHTFLKFPLMEKLNYIQISSEECELGPGNVEELQECLPKLKTLQLYDQPGESLAKWTQNSKFENAEELVVSTVNEGLREANDAYYVSPGTEILTQLHQSFPKVWFTDFTFNISDLNGLKYVFQNMIQLKSLAITFAGNEAELNNSAKIDSTLLGLSLLLVIALKDDMKLLETGVISIKGGTEPSIRNLTELHTLKLTTYKGLEVDEVGDGDRARGSLLSELLFELGFMKMTKLRNLHLYDKFHPSSGMEKKWKEQERIMKYSEEDPYD